MPYGRRTYTRRAPRKTYARRPTVSLKAMESIARREVKRAVIKDHPLQWTDIIFDGGNVNTTPTMHSFVNAIRSAVDTDSLWAEWPQHNRNGSTATYQTVITLASVHYQLRFQQDVENIESSNTFRTLMYSFKDTYDENNVALLSGASIDLPPNTEKVNNMYFDRMRALRAGTYDPSGADEADPTPGTAILKNTKRLGHKITMWHIEGGNTGWDNNDVRWEAQSDTIGDGLQLYGFIRVYYRIMS